MPRDQESWAKGSAASNTADAAAAGAANAASALLDEAKNAAASSHDEAVAAAATVSISNRTTTACHTAVSEITPSFSTAPSWSTWATWL